PYPSLLSPFCTLPSPPTIYTLSLHDALPIYRTLTTACAILCALVFFAIQYSGVKQQAVVMLWLTYAAIAALVWFWLGAAPGVALDRKSTRLNSSHQIISYAVFCLKKKNKIYE